MSHALALRMPNPGAVVRLQKFLADAGVASRRRAEDLIAEGAVAVNGTRATIGMSVDPAHDDVRVRGVRVRLPSAHTTIIFHKPAGVVTTRADERSRKTVYDLLPKQYRMLRCAGRLDRDSEGLLLLTSDGAWIERLTHPRFRVEKEYVVHPLARPTYAQLAALRRGASVHGDKQVRPMSVAVTSGTLHIVIREGAKHEVRSLCRSAGIPVLRLIRVRIGDIKLPSDLKAGAWRVLPQPRTP